ncbi:MAG: hypothetical protein R3Y26_03090 [Rikenellaceae bacterium]
MKKTTTILVFFLMAMTVKAQDKILVGGTLSDKIAIINKSTKEIEWEHKGFAGECKECNSLVHLKGEDVAYAHKKGVYFINSQGEMLFEFKVGKGEEFQSVSVIKGGYLLGISGNPMRIVEINKKGEVTKELTFDTEVTNIHRQFRQITKTKKGHYLVPISDSKRLVELDANGGLVKDIKIEHSSLYVATDKKGNWLATTGHAGVIYKIDGKTGVKSKIVDSPNLGDDIKIEFGAGIVELKNGNYLLANWVGHNGDQKQPILIELDKAGKVVWTMNKIDQFTFAAGIYPIY